MKPLILRLLRALSLVPSGHLREAERRLRDADTREAAQREKIDRLAHAVAAERAKIEDVRRELRDTAHRLKVADAGREAAEAARKTALADAAAARTRGDQQVDEMRAGTEQWKARATALVDELRQIRTKLAAAEKTEVQLREALMATEVKLDLIEAAINTLDARHRRTGTPTS